MEHFALNDIEAAAAEENIQNRNAYIKNKNTVDMLIGLYVVREDYLTASPPMSIAQLLDGRAEMEYCKDSFFDVIQAYKSIVVKKPLNSEDQKFCCELLVALRAYYTANADTDLERGIFHILFWMLQPKH
jgi:hypothetical protein